MRSFYTLFFVLAVIATAQEASCTNEIYGTVEHGKNGYAACDLILDGYRFAPCVNGVFGEDNVSNCKARTVSIFSYGMEAASYKVGETVSTISLLTDGVFTAFAISPELPAGMTFSTTNGQIAGAPSAAAAETEYTITGTPSSEGAEASTTTIKITVNAIVCAAFDSFPETANGQIASSTTACPAGTTGTAKRTCTDGHFGDLDISSCTPVGPSGLTYTGNNQIVVNRNEHAIITPSFSGTVSSFAIVPALPTGLSINQSKGTISGVPTVTSAQKYYTVTATGPAGTTPATATVSITVNNAKCTGLTTSTGTTSSINHGNTISFPCEDGYTGSWTYTCDNGVFKNKNTDVCIASKPTGFSYAKTEFAAFPGEVINTGIPTISGVVQYYECNNLPEGFIIDPATGVISGSSVTPINVPVTVTAVADPRFHMESSTTININVKEVTCEGTEDFRATNVGGSAIFKCPEGYEGEMKRTCKNENNNGVFALPSYHCQKVYDYTFFYICCGILAVCVIFCLIGCCVKSSRQRTKDQKKTLPKTKAAPKPAAATKPAAPKAAKKVAI